MSVPVVGAVCGGRCCVDVVSDPPVVYWRAQFQLAARSLADVATVGVEVAHDEDVVMVPACHDLGVEGI